jgi:hypothetical protein
MFCNLRSNRKGAGLTYFNLVDAALVYVELPYTVDIFSTKTISPFLFESVFFS